MGTPGFAVPVLERLIVDHEVVAVYTRPDAVSGRGKRLVPPPVKVRALESGIPVLQPVSLRTPDAAQALRGFEPDVVVVAAYGMILPAEILEVPPAGCVNVHASLLPAYRGAAPVHRAILAGDAVTGVSIMKMEEGLDTGPYALQRSIEVDDLDAETLTDRLAHLGAEALSEVLDSIAAGTVIWVDQDEALATYASKISKDDVAIEPDVTVLTALRRVRASSRQASTRIVVGDFELAVLSASPHSTPLPAGTARKTAEGLLLGMADGTLRVDRLRPAGKSDTDGASWARGARMTDDLPWRRA